VVGYGIKVAENDNQGHKCPDNGKISKGNPAGIRESFHDDLLLRDAFQCPQRI
jgi:hypothetical protein